MDIASYPIDNGRREGSGAPSIAQVTGVEKGGFVKQTVLTLVNVPVTVTSVTTGAGVGGTKIFDFPEGWLAVFGTTAELSVSVAAAKQDDFTDGAVEGDIGIGSAAPADADALGTDATDDDFATAAAILMASFTDASVSLGSEAARNINGSATAVDMYVNVLIDAGDIDDGTETEVLVSGTVKVTWLSLGDL